MKSRDSIKQELISIANRHGYQGEMVEIAANLLTYALFSTQTEVLNASQESSLSTAKLMNSKIRECMNVMYSVYRGNNARVILNILPHTLINKSKYDLIYESNTFKLYSVDALNINPVVANTSVETTTQVECIFSSKTKYVYETVINSDNQYYVDVKDDAGHLLSDLSEDVKVSISYDNGTSFIEYPTTRDFYEHMTSLVPENPTESSELDKLFILTTQDYGLRIYKRGHYKVSDDNKLVKSSYFQIDTIIRVECFKYTKLDEINEDEFKKIMIPGTELRSFDQANFEGYKTGRKKVQEIDREDGNAILYNANSSTRIQSQILSSSDINHLFTEYFIDTVLYANNRFDKAHGWYNPELKTDSLMIFYVPKTTNYMISTTDLNNFCSNYKSYFITHDILSAPAQLIRIHLSLTIVITDHSEIINDLNEILVQYENILTTRSNYINEDFVNDPTLDKDTQYYKSLIDTKYLQSQISKINNVKYIDNYQYSKLEYVGTDKILSNVIEIPTSYEKSVLISDGSLMTMRVPVYYKFVPSIIYKNSYEIVP